MEDTTPKTTQATDNSKPISAMPELTTAQGSTLVPVVDGGNKKVKLSTIKSYINEGMVAQQTGKGLSANDYTDGDKAKLGALPTNAELETSLAGKQAVFTTSDELSMSAQNKLSLTDKAKMLLFIDQWNTACGTWGKYDPANAPDAQHPFYLNTLWLTYAEAIAVMHNKWGVFNDRAQCPNNIRTNLPNSYIYTHYASGNDYVNMASMFASTKLEVLRLWPDNFYVDVDEISAAFIYSAKLKSILGIIDTRQITEQNKVYNTFKGCAGLEEVSIRNLKLNLAFPDSPLVSLASLQYLVTNAANTSEITVTVHPNVYAKLSGDTTNAAAAALTADELAAWQAVMTAASAKNIAFATTE